MRFPHPAIPLACVLLASSLLGCNNGGTRKTRPVEEPQTLRVETLTATTNNRGVYKFDIEVKEGERFQAIFEEDGKAYLATESLIDPAGETALDWQDWLYSDYSLTEALYATEFVSTLNWPVREEDGPIAPGTWTIEGSATSISGDPKSGAAITATLLYRSDDDLQKGTIHAIIAYCTGLREDSDIVAGIEAGVAYWQQLYASWGIDLTVEYSDIDVDPALPDTYKGVTAYQDLLDTKEGYPLLMVIGDLIADDNYIYGEAGAIPGPMIGTPISAVEVSWIAHAGANGQFSDWEIGVLGETMAHETGHYLGMFHPVEMDWNYWDAVSDTDACTSTGSCERNLGKNLMFPYSLCYGASNCESQDELTDGQIGIMQRYAGVE